VRVVGSRDEAPRVTAAERGERLFLAKGCVTCHGEGGVGAGPFGPSLKGRWLAPEYVKLFLRDPSIRPPSQPGWEMPNLHLSEVEVDALAAFLNPKLTKTETASLP
jgi:mono/diheme cytochrome c family protein